MTGRFYRAPPRASQENQGPGATVAAVNGATCPRHPDAAAIGACTRCGGFVCAQDVVLLDSKPYCQACAALPEVDYLEQLRLKHWGKRDGWAWLFLFNGVLLPFAAVPQLLGELAVVGVLELVLAAASLAYFFRFRPARYLVLALPVLALVSAFLATGEPIGAVFALFPLLVGLAIFFDTRNRLFFKIPVPRAQLQRLWDVYENNPLARAGFMGGLLSLLMFPLAPVALALSIVGLTRVNPAAHPPVGRKGQAIAGIVLSALGLVVLGWVVVNALTQ